MKIYLAQIDTIVGDFDGNLEKILFHLKKAEKAGAEIAVFPELCLTGYPLMDLLNYSSFIDKSEEYLGKLAASVGETAALVGHVERDEESREGLGVFNSAALLYKGEVVFNQRKMLLPTYDVFDEKRYFEPGPESEIFKFKGKKLAITVCEDIWNDSDFWNTRRYHQDPLEILTRKGAEILLNISASPFNLDKIQLRAKLMEHLCSKYNIPGLIINSIGGNDELIFDGTSMLFDDNGKPRLFMKSFEEDSTVIDMDKLPDPVSLSDVDIPSPRQAFEALVLGVKDYFSKCGFTKALLGLSGGIDSAVTAVIAAEALGPENVLAVIMPSRYSSEASVTDAEGLSENLGLETRIISIEPVYQAYLDLFEEEFKGMEMDTTEENFQARIRGNILMGFSNKYGHLLLSTGNKSEVAVGYCTLYGDMSGGLAVLSDLPKTLVYEVAEYINRDSEIIPRNSIDKPPSAELRPDQTDQDSLPPYDLLDEILFHYIEKERDLEEITELGFSREIVDKIIRMVDRSEYKRKQMPTGLKITGRAFGFGRRMPIAQKYHR